ncbi:MAG: M48 family metalloprotease [Bdellovibrionaceae bacterium]|jgi:heat shock protein HtpX|nr:M48 family metalloprotease [Pseudobdellovibrionaceae bacterium]
MRFDNQLRSWLFLGVTSVIILSLCQVYWGRNGLLWAFALLFTSNSLFFFLGESHIKNFFDYELLEGRDPWGITEFTQNLSNKLHMNKPLIYIIPVKQCQSFALGQSFNKGRIYLTKGLIDSLNIAEIESILAYHIVSIKHHHTQAFSLMSSVAGSFLYITYRVDYLFSWLLMNTQKKVRFNKGGLITRLTAQFLAIIFNFIFSPGELLKVDRITSQLTGNSQALASALWKIESYSKTDPLQVPLHLSHLFIINPQNKGTLMNYFGIQPKTAQRINKLLGHYPI